jgi:hypothetical protein
VQSDLDGTRSASLQRVSGQDVPIPPQVVICVAVQIETLAGIPGGVLSKLAP